jgi:hypothetical protein
MEPRSLPRDPARKLVSHCVPGSVRQRRLALLPDPEVRRVYGAYQICQGFSSETQGEVEGTEDTGRMNFIDCRLVYSLDPL